MSTLPNISTSTNMSAPSPMSTSSTSPDVMPEEKLKASFPEKFYTDPTGIDRYVVQEKVLFTWDAPTKLPAPSLPKIGLGIGIVAVGVGVILFLTGDVMVAALIIVILIVYNIIINRPLTYLKVQITTIGIKIEDKYYYWSEMTQYWFEGRRGVPVLMVRDPFHVPQVLKLIVKEEYIDELMPVIGKYLLYKKPQDTWKRKTTQFLRSLLPFDLDFL